MKLRILSDLHMEFVKYQPDVLPSEGEDVVILAGDIGVGIHGVEWAMKAITDRPVIYVLGNHEYYGHDYQTLLGQCKAVSKGSNVNVLENEEIFIKGQRFLCATLWTDWTLFGEQRMAEAARWGTNNLNDYRIIRNGAQALSSNDTFEACEATKAWLVKSLSEGEPAVVVTHHAPTPSTMNPVYGFSISNASFHSDLDSMFNERVLLWAHGHTHYSCEAKVNNVPVVTNQKGYPHENFNFDWGYMVEVETPKPFVRSKKKTKIKVDQ